MYCARSRASVWSSRFCTATCDLLLRFRLVRRPALRLSMDPLVPSESSARRLKRRAKPESPLLLPSVASSLRSSPRFSSALSSLVVDVSNVPSAFSAMPMPDSRPHWVDALLASLSTPRNWLCMPSAPWSPCSEPPVLLSAL